ncbi:hypothetical protein YC2023_099509 [Brassica napus]
MIIPYGGTETGVSYILLSFHTILQETRVEDLASIALQLMSANQKERICLPDRAFLFFSRHRDIVALVDQPKSELASPCATTENQWIAFLQLAFTLMVRPGKSKAKHPPPQLQTKP